MNDTQGKCDRRFTEILPHLARGQREYTQPDGWRAPEGTYPAFGRFFSTLAYQLRSVIAWCAFETGQRGSEYSACKLSERVSPVFGGRVAGAFSSLGRFLLFLFTAL